MTRCNVEDISRLHLDHAAIIHGSGRPSGNDHAYMFDITTCESQRLANVGRSLPARFVGGTADHHPTDPNHLELAFLEFPNLVRLIEPL